MNTDSDPSESQVFNPLILRSVPRVVDQLTLDYFGTRETIYTTLTKDGVTIDCLKDGIKTSIFLHKGIAGGIAEFIIKGYDNPNFI